MTWVLILCLLGYSGVVVLPVCWLVEKAFWLAWTIQLNWPRKKK